MPCWKTHIQSFYDCSIPFLTIKKIEQDLINNFGEKLGIEATYDLESLSEEKLCEHWCKEQNFIFKTNYKQNVKSGYWEIEYLTRTSIQVPENMR